MLNTADVKAVVRPLAERAVAPAHVQDVRVSPLSDAQGMEALDVVVIADAISPEGVDAREDASVHVLHALQAKGEDRHAYIRFVEASWLEDEAVGE